MSKILLCSVILFGFLPLLAQSTPAMPPAELKPVEKTVEIDPRKVMLMKLIDAGILMLEGKAYQQFIQAFVGDEDRRRFEQAFSRNGPVNYEAWGKEKGEQMLRVLKTISGKEPIWLMDHACFVNENAPSQKFSFAYSKGAWFIENHSKCPMPETKKPAEAPKN
jgi:hypothetical protein